MFIVFLFLCILNADQDSYALFNQATKYYSLMPDIISLQEEKPKSLVFYSIDDTWNYHHFKFYNKASTIKEIKELEAKQKSVNETYITAQILSRSLDKVYTIFENNLALNKNSEINKK